MMGILLFYLPLIWLSSSSPSHALQQSFVECFSSYSSPQSIPISKVVFTNESASFSSLLHQSIRNLRFLNTSSKPLFLVTPFHESHVQAAVVCAQKKGLQLRVRSGGHDYEGIVNVLKFKLMGYTLFGYLSIFIRYDSISDY